jgi:DNA primase
MSQVEDIKSRLDIVDIIRDYIQLKAAGMNFRALCPFHRENSPSFMVSPDKQIWHCFGCGKGGDVISFVQEIEGLSFIETLRILAPKAGVTLERQDPKIASQRNRLIDIIEISKNFFYEKLINLDDNDKITKYLKARGLKEETISEWGIGYAPDSWDDLINLLKQKGFTDNEIFLSGMSIKKEGMNRFYNRFRDRIMFPINDVNGVTVAFTARVNPDKEENEKMGKYINSPQTLIYNKSKIFFGLDFAKMAIKSEDSAIITEGQMDVISAHQAGFKNVIASSGTALTHEQVILVKRYTNNILFAFDMDKAGQMAADRGIKEVMAVDMNIKVISIPSGKDPDECIQNNPEEWSEAVVKAQLVMEYYFDKILTDLNLDDITKKRKVASELLTVISRIPNKIEKDHWIKKLSERLEVDDGLLRDAMITGKKEVARRVNNSSPELPVAPEQKKKTRGEMLAEFLIAILIKYPFLISYIERHLSLDQIEGEDNKSIYKNLIIYYNNTISSTESSTEAQINYFGLKDWLINQKDNHIEKSATPQDNSSYTSQLKLLDQLVILGDRDFYDLGNEDAKKEIVKIVLYIKDIYYASRKKDLEKLISQAEKNKDNEQVKGLIEELKILTEESSQLQE